MALDADFWSAVGTGGGAVVALIAAGFAFWQAQIARGARDATAEQAKVAREALELQRAEQHERGAPEFALKIEPATGEYAAHVEVRMISGPPEIAAEISYANGWVRRTGDDVERHASRGQQVHRQRMVRNFVATYGHTAEPDAAAIWSEVTIKSTEIGGAERKWRHVERVDWFDRDNPPW